jgi:hypothetical protein
MLVTVVKAAPGIQLKTSELRRGRGRSGRLIYSSSLSEPLSSSSPLDSSSASQSLISKLDENHTRENSPGSGELDPAFW